MDQNSCPPISPTLAKVLDSFSEKMKTEEIIEDAAVDRLDALLRSGKVPKLHEISAALLSPEDEEEAEEENSS